MKLRAVALHFFLIGLTINSSAHEGHAHKESKTRVDVQVTDGQNLALVKINEGYKQNVKPIFQRSCFDCHSQNSNLPWYYSVPIVHGLIEEDMKEAKVHLDFSKDFPFTGHGSPKEDLEAIEKCIEHGKMPPFRYKIMHSNARLSSEEQQTVLMWAREGIDILKERKD